MELTTGWEVTATSPGLAAGPGDLTGCSWAPATVPGTAAGAVGADGRDFDAEDWWFRCVFPGRPEWSGSPISLELDGLATVAEVYFNGALILESESMWQAHSVDIGDRLGIENELLIACRALTPLLSRRRRPSARWRTRVVNAGNLRWYRTMIFGRSPGFAPGPAAVGPWRPVRLVNREQQPLRALRLRTRLDGSTGVIRVQAAGHLKPGAARITVGGQSAPLRIGPEARVSGELRIPGVEKWWPHTHGNPALHDVAIELDGQPATSARVGFRSLTWPPDIVGDGLALAVDGIPLFVRGAVWTPADLVTMAPSETDLRRLLVRIRDAGMNMLRVTGTGAYESRQFHSLCDELGILVWQDLMFANLDYPVSDQAFADEVRREAREVFERIGSHPSTAVICGNSEVEQQPAMLGLDPALGRAQLWDESLPEIVVEAEVDCAYLRSTPCGGALPFHPGGGAAHYFGVSGFFGAPEDARRAEVRFASECLAFANVPDEVAFPVHHPQAKAGVQRDAGTGWDLGAGWDFDDVRDHYLRLLYGVDPVQLRRSDHSRYLELSRAATGEVMAEVLGDWRRARSGCRGALVLWSKDMAPGAGLGLLDDRGAPKVAYHHVRRILAPVAVWTTDEKVAGVGIHIANDRPAPLRARLRIALYRDLKTLTGDVVHELELAGHTTTELNLEAMLGRFVDAAWSYRFGPPAQTAIVVSLERAGGERPLSQAVHFPAGPPLEREPANRFELRGRLTADPAGGTEIELWSRRLLYGIRLKSPGFEADDDTFTLEPGRPRRIGLRKIDGRPTPPAVTLTAINLAGEIVLPTTG